MRRRLALVGACLLVAGCGGEQHKPQPRPAFELPPLAEMAVYVGPGRHLELRSSPGGPIIGRIGSRTEFGSQQVLDPVTHEGEWLAVRHPSLGNDRTAWIDARRAPIYFQPRPVRLEVDISRRLLLVRDKTGVERRISVAIGAPDTPTPAGDFYVTDKLPGERFGSYYGCCILALSGRQPNLPRGWSGGDRLAIHGSPTPTEGKAVSNGCLHAHERDLRYLMRVVPLGAAVHIHA